MSFTYLATLPTGSNTCRFTQITVPLFSASTMDVFRCADFETAEMTAEKAHSPSVLLTSCIEAISCCVDCLQRNI